MLCSDAASEEIMQTRNSISALLATSLILLVPACDKFTKSEAEDSKSEEKAKVAEPDAKVATKDSGAAPESGAVGDTPKDEPCPEGMVHIDGGTFFIGSQKDSKILETAKPQHKVRLSPFCMGKNEVAVAEYESCVKAGKCEDAHQDSFYPQGSKSDAEWAAEREKFSEYCNWGKPDRKDHPINCVTWGQADRYCRAQGGRLPTEAEWEFAARGPDGRVYPWGDEPPSQIHANTCGSECVKWRTERDLPEHAPMFPFADDFSGTAPVGSFPKGTTADGINDLIGNVFEWVSTKFHAYPDTEEEDPQGPTDGDQFVIRGGAFNSFMPDFTDPALRFGQDADAHVHAIGFRCATPAKSP
jgi:formylglycine-generating enzyme required for sulfatase activity